MTSEQIMVVLIATVFGGLGALMAFSITYDEYSHHFLDRSSAVRMAFQTALVAFLFFVGVGFLLAVIMPHVMGPGVWRLS